MQRRCTGLWRHRDFMLLWTGQAISQIGSRITRGALPLVALYVLHASPVQLGVLKALAFAPVLVVGLLAGVYVDRVRRRPLLIAADLGRAFLLLLIPLAVVFRVLGIELLGLIAALVGVLTVIFDVAYLSFLPSVVGRTQLVEGNSKLGVSESVAELVGPALGGVLVQALAAPFAILFDAVSFLISAVFLGRMRVVEAQPVVVPDQTPRQVWHEIMEGARRVRHDPLLWPLGMSLATSSFFGGFFGALYEFYAINVLGLGPALLGLVIAVGGVAALLGATTSAWTVRRFGLGSTLIGSLVLTGCVQLFIPLARGPVLGATALLMLAQLGDWSGVVHHINAVSLRQAITADHILGRVNGSMRLIEGGLTTVGLLVGGGLGQAIGPRWTLALSAIGIGLSAIWLLRSPIRELRTVPSALVNEVGATT